jgi:ABC-type arginine transport system permease subunit
MNFRKIGMLTLGILAGNWVVDNFVIRSEANPRGMVEASAGFGLDDLVRSGVVATTAIVLTRFVR